MANDPENLVLELLRGIRAEIADMKGQMTQVATKADLVELRAELKSDMNSLRADVASDIHTLRAEVKKDLKVTGEQIVGLRRAVIEYQSSVIGHGMLIGELDAPVRRMEQHLELPPLDSH